MLHSACLSHAGKRYGGEAKMNDFRMRAQPFLAMFMLLVAMLVAGIVLGISAAPIFTAG